MKIGIIDVDGHNYPNLALMRIASAHKADGDSVEWYSPLLSGHCDVVYMSKVFSFTPDYDFVVNADRIVRGGTGYGISLNGCVEMYTKAFDGELPPNCEAAFPDYTMYPQFSIAISMTTRGCPRGCSFCHVGNKEGRKSVKVADVSDFYDGQREIQVLDANLTACPDKRELFRQYMETGAMLEFNQGLDIRLLDDDDIADLNRMRIKRLHFAWDRPNDDLEGHFRRFAQAYKRKNRGMVYCLVNFGSTVEQDLHRIYTLRDLGYDPFVMVYDRTHAPKYARHLQRWCNNKIIFKSCRRFEDYRTGRTEDD